jgi:hypothetical protein
MLLTNHILSGALIGAVVRRPLPAFLAGVASHFVLDAVPHWGNWRDRRQFLQVAVPDGLTGLAIMSAVTAAAPPSRRIALAAGMAGAALPDIDKPSLLWFGVSPFPAAVGRFHSGIQDEALDRYGREACVAALLAATALLLLRSAVRAGAEFGELRRDAHTGPASPGLQSRRAPRSGRRGGSGGSSPRANTANTVPAR